MLSRAKVYQVLALAWWVVDATCTGSCLCVCVATLGPAAKLGSANCLRGSCLQWERALVRQSTCMCCVYNAAGNWQTNCCVACFLYINRYANLHAVHTQVAVLGLL